MVDRFVDWLLDFTTVLVGLIPTLIFIALFWAAGHYLMGLTNDWLFGGITGAILGGRRLNELNDHFYANAAD